MELQTLSCVNNVHLKYILPTTAIEVALSATILHATYII